MVIDLIVSDLTALLLPRRKVQLPESAKGNFERGPRINEKWSWLATLLDKKKKLPLLPAAAAAKLGQTINLEQILYFSFEEKNCQNLSKF